MASNTDAAFVEDTDIEQQLRARAHGSKPPKTPGATSPGLDSDDEDAPLLGASPAASGHEQWAGDADFRGLPWWKRPSVRPCSPSRRERID